MVSGTIPVTPAFPAVPGVSPALPAVPAVPAKPHHHVSPVAEIRPSADTVPPVISNIVVMNVTSSSVTILWSTDEPSDSQIEYGLTDAYGSVSPFNIFLVTSHSAVLENLHANTLYYFRVKSKDKNANSGVSNQQLFQTSALAAAPSFPPVSSLQPQAALTWMRKKVSDDIGSGIPAIGSNGSGYGVVWVDDSEKNVKFARTNESGDIVVSPKIVYSPGFTIWKDVSVVAIGFEYGVAIAVQEKDGWRVYLLRIDNLGNLLSQSLLGKGGVSPYSGPAIAWVDGEYAVVWNRAADDGVSFAKYSPSLMVATVAEKKIMSFSRACDVAISWNGNRFGVMCNEMYGAVDVNGNEIVSPVKTSCNKDSVPGFAGHPSIVWNGSMFLVLYHDHWLNWHGALPGSIYADGSASNCYGTVESGIQNPITRSSFTTTSGVRRQGENGWGIAWLESRKVKFREWFFSGINTTVGSGDPAVVESSATVLGNISWSGDRYGIIWKNGSGMYITLNQ